MVVSPRRWLDSIRADVGRSRVVTMLFLLFACGCVAQVIWGRTMVDEGWYLAAGRLVLGGRLPYRDFFFPQAPLAALAFVPPALLGEHALWAARSLCTVAGLAGVAIILRTAHRTGGKGALAWTAALLMASYTFCYGLATARSYAFVVLLVALAFDRLARDDRAGSGWMQGTVLASLATALRPSIAPVLLLLWGLGIWRRRHQWIRQTAATILPVSLVIVPFVLLGGDRFWFGVFDFHAIYYGNSAQARALAPAFWRELFLDQPVAMVLAGFAGVLWIALAYRARRASLAPALRLAGVAFASWIILLALHATRHAPFAHHQNMFLPVLALATGLTLGEVKRPAWLLRFSPVLAWAVALATSYRLSGLGPPRWNGEGAPSQALTAARLVAEHAQGRSVLTFDPLLAILSGSPTVDGFETGIFSYWPRMRGAEQMGGRNESDLRQLLFERRVPVLALSRPDLRFIAQTSSTGSDLLGVLDHGYRVVARISRYGQWADDLLIFRIRDE